MSKEFEINPFIELSALLNITFVCSQKLLKNSFILFHTSIHLDLISSQFLYNSTPTAISAVITAITAKTGAAIVPTATPNIPDNVVIVVIIGANDKNIPAKTPTTLIITVIIAAKV